MAANSAAAASSDDGAADDILSSTGASVINQRAFVASSGMPFGMAFQPQLPATEAGATSSSAEHPLWLVMLLDTSLPEPELRAAAAGLGAAAAQLPPSVRVLCGTVGRVVSFFDLSSSTPRAHVIHGVSSKGAAGLPGLVQALDLTAQPLSDCLGRLQAALGAVRAHRQPQVLQRHIHALASALDIGLYLLSVSLAAWDAAAAQHQQQEQPQQQPQQQPGSPTPRRSKAPHNTHVVCCTGAPAAWDGELDEPLDGKAAAHMRDMCASLGAKAAAAGTPLDVLLAALPAEQVLACLAAAADGSAGGRLIRQPNFAPPFSGTVAAAVQRRIGWEGVLDVRVPPGAAPGLSPLPLSLPRAHLRPLAWNPDTAHRVPHGTCTCMQMRCRPP